MNTENIRMDNGRHKGELLTRVPVGYLKWMVNAKHKQSSLAKAELERRGTVTPELELSGHAIDRFSQRCMNVWRAERDGEEGLNAFMLRVCGEALQMGVDEEGCVVHLEMKFVFGVDGVWPVLKSIMMEEK